MRPRSPAGPIGVARPGGTVDLHRNLPMLPTPDEFAVGGVQRRTPRPSESATSRSVFSAAPRSPCTWSSTPCSTGSSVHTDEDLRRAITVMSVDDWRPVADLAARLGIAGILGLGLRHHAAGAEIADRLALPYLSPTDPWSWMLSAPRGSASLTEFWSAPTLRARRSGSAGSSSRARPGSATCRAFPTLTGTRCCSPTPGGGGTSRRPLFPRCASSGAAGGLPRTAVTADEGSASRGAVSGQVPPFLAALAAGNPRRLAWVLTVQVITALTQGVGLLLLVPLLELTGVSRAVLRGRADGACPRGSSVHSASRSPSAPCWPSTSPWLPSRRRSPPIRACCSCAIAWNSSMSCASGSTEPSPAPSGGTFSACASPICSPR